MSKTQAALQRRLGRLSMLIDIADKQMPNNRGLARDFQHELELLKESSMLEDPFEIQRRLGRISVLVDRARKALPNDVELLVAMMKEIEQSREIASRLDIPRQQMPA